MAVNTHWTKWRPYCKRLHHTNQVHVNVPCIARVCDYNDMYVHCTCEMSVFLYDVIWYQLRCILYSYTHIQRWYATCSTNLVNCSVRVTTHTHTHTGTHTHTHKSLWWSWRGVWVLWWGMWGCEGVRVWGCEGVRLGMWSLWEVCVLWWGLWECAIGDVRFNCDEVKEVCFGEKLWGFAERVCVCVSELWVCATGDVMKSERCVCACVWVLWWKLWGCATGDVRYVLVSVLTLAEEEECYEFGKCGEDIWNQLKFGWPTLQLLSRINHRITHLKAMS